MKIYMLSWHQTYIDACFFRQFRDIDYVFCMNNKLQQNEKNKIKQASPWSLVSYKKGLHIVFKSFGVEIRPAHHIKLYHLFSIILFFILVKMMCRPGPIGLKAATPLLTSSQHRTDVQVAPNNDRCKLSFVYC